jgi:copper oxidase (laccase) domain-containing protein
MKNYFSYPLGKYTLNLIDLSIPQRNYSCKYSDDALKNQMKFFKENNLEKLFHKRTVMACNFKSTIKKIENFSFSNYSGKISNCNGFDGIFTSIPELPLVTAFGDCPQLMVVGKNNIGIVHAGRKVLDDNIIELFFNQFSRYEKLSECKIGFSPYIFQENFSHNFLNFNRDWEDSINLINGKFYVDLKKMIVKDLKNVGIKEENIFDAKIDTYKLSLNSQNSGGYQISHRQASNKEGRGLLLIMLKN